jgi:hypothetical protein
LLKKFDKVNTSNIDKLRNGSFTKTLSFSNLIMNGYEMMETKFSNNSSLKQQSTGRHVAPLGHIILIPSQPVFALSP